MCGMSSRMRGGRPSTLTAELKAQLVERIRVGNVVAAACASCKVPRSTFYDWYRRGDRFRARIEEGREEAATRLFAEVAPAGDWRDVARLLERFAPERWSIPVLNPAARTHRVTADPPCVGAGGSAAASRFTR
jgi:hypothetical protein